MEIRAEGEPAWTFARKFAISPYIYNEDSGETDLDRMKLVWGAFEAHTRLSYASKIYSEGNLRQLQGKMAPSHVHARTRRKHAANGVAFLLRPANASEMGSILAYPQSQTYLPLTKLIVTPPRKERRGSPEIAPTLLCA